MLGPCFDQSGIHLPTNLARFVLGTVDITYKLPALKLAYWSSVSLEPVGTDQTPSVPLSSVIMGRPALAWRTYVNVRHHMIQGPAKVRQREVIPQVHGAQ